MAQTYQGMQDRINLDYLNRTDLQGETQRAIIRAIQHYERTRLWFNQTQTAINASTGSYSLTLPADFLALDMVTYTNNGGAPLIIPQHTYERVTYRNQNATSGVPIECAVYNSQLWLTPKPSSAFPVTLAYTFRLVQLSASTDTNSWCTEAEDLICFHATADLIANVVRGQAQDVMTYKQLEQQALMSLQKARDIRMNVNEDLSVIGPIQRQEPAKTDGGVPRGLPGQMPVNTGLQ